MKAPEENITTKETTDRAEDATTEITSKNGIMEDTTAEITGKEDIVEDK